MLILILISLSMITSSQVVPRPWLWPTSLIQSTSLALTTLLLTLPHHQTLWHSLSNGLATDSLSTPLMILSTWLLPLTLLASRHHLLNEPLPHQRAYITLLSLLTLTLMMTFTALNLILFYMAFESTLIPTLILITRWGHQPERLQAGTYFMFYTLFGSLPLLTSLLYITSFSSSSDLPLILLNNEFLPPNLNSLTLWWLASILAFLAKLPMYGLHLWLPKAHVEAPMAGSMILAAILLKLGGYGLLRISTMFQLPATSWAEPLITLTLWGTLITSMICTRQTDMKALMAYSSVGHMSLLTAAMLNQSPASANGALMLMITHGLISSLLFCLANLTYERTSSRTLFLNRGLKTITPLTAYWWLTASAANFALPPLPSFPAELLIMSSMFAWDPWTILILGPTTLFTAIYSLYLYQSSQNTPTPSTLKKTKPNSTAENLNIFLHLAPLLLLPLKLETMIIS